METIILQTDLHCANCARRIEPILNGDSAIKDFKIDLNHPKKIITIQAENLDVDAIIERIGKAGYMADRYSE